MVNALKHVLYSDIKMNSEVNGVKSDGCIRHDSIESSIPSTRISPLLHSDMILSDDEFRKGYAFETGDGVSQDLRQAEIHYVNSSSPVSSYRLGCMLESGVLRKPDAKSAFRRMRKAADAGYCPAMMKLAEYYADGFGIDRDPVIAIDIYLDLYHESVDDSSEQQALDGMRGILERFDKESSVREYLTGLVCEGVLTDPMFREALSHYENAGARGIPEAWFRAGVLHEIKSISDIGSAIRCYKFSFEGKNVQSSMRLGILCFEGKGLKQDISLAFKFFRRAAEGGDPYGQFWSAIMMQYGIGTEKDGRTAKQFYESAVKAGISDASLWEGLLLRYGAENVPKNVMEAHRLFKKASDLGIGRAMYELGRIYEDGAGVKVDMSTARRYYGMADRNGCHVVNGYVVPLDSMSCLEEMIRLRSAIYLQTRSSVETESDNEDSSEVLGGDKVHDEEANNSASQEVNETPAQVLKRLKDRMDMGGQGAKDARDEAMFLFNSCFGLDTDFDRMYQLYITALSDHTVGELQYRIAQMMQEENSPIHDRNRALEWYEKAMENGKIESAIHIGDHYLDGKPSPDLMVAASWYIQAIRRRSDFWILESRFSRIRDTLRKSKETELMVTIARNLVQSRLAGHDTVLKFYTDALELGRAEVAIELKDYIQSFGLKYDREDLLESSLKILDERAVSNKDPGSSSARLSGVTKGCIVKAQDLAQFYGHMVTKLFPYLIDKKKLDAIIRYDRCIDRFVVSPKEGIGPLSNLCPDPQVVLDIYSGSRKLCLDDLYSLANGLIQHNEYIGTRLMCIAAASGHAQALRDCIERMNIFEVEDVSLAVDLLRKSVAVTGDPDSMYKLAQLYLRYPAYEDSEKADRLLEDAAKMKHQDASMLLVVRRSKVDNTVKNLKKSEDSSHEIVTVVEPMNLLFEAAERDEMWAIMEMGKRSRSRDIWEAIKWYSRAAELGNPEAMCRLGIIFRNNDTFKDHNKSMSYLKQAAKLGNGEAMYILGTMYEITDRMKATEYYRKSMKAGYKFAASKLFRKDVEIYKLSYNFELSSRNEGFRRTLGDDSGRYMENSWER